MGNPRHLKGLTETIIDVSGNTHAYSIYLYYTVERLFPQRYIQHLEYGPICRLWMMINLQERTIGYDCGGQQTHVCNVYTPDYSVMSFFAP